MGDSRPFIDRVEMPAGIAGHGRQRQEVGCAGSLRGGLQCAPVGSVTREQASNACQERVYPVCTFLLCSA
jgi:hypothetical protein